jgi:hypothetical protein
MLDVTRLWNMEFGKNLDVKLIPGHCRYRSKLFQHDPHLVDCRHLYHRQQVEPRQHAHLPELPIRVRLLLRLPGDRHHLHSIHLLLATSTTSKVCSTRNESLLSVHCNTSSRVTSRLVG